MKFSNKKNNFKTFILLMVIMITSLSFKGSQFAFSQSCLLGPSKTEPPQIDGTAFTLYDVNTDTFLLGQNQDYPLSPASTTKVLTVLIALEKLNLSDEITVTREMFQTIPNDYVRLGLMEGEVITVEDAIYSCMLISANDSAMALALTVSNSIEEFCVIMNEKAKQIGCTSTNFTNPYGYADCEHLCSPNDLALILTQALNNEEFKKIANSKSYSMNATNLFKTPRGMTNGNKLLSSSKLSYEYFIGGKTGYTDLSGQTIVAGASKNGRVLVVVIFGAKTSEARYKDTVALFEYGFSQYKMKELSNENFDSVASEVINQIEMFFSADNTTLEISNKSLNFTKEIIVPFDLNISDLHFLTKTNEVIPASNQESQVLEYPIYYKIFDNAPRKIGSLKHSIKIIPIKEAPKSSIDFVDVFIIALAVVIVVTSISLYIAFCKYKKKKRRRVKVHRRI